MLLWQSLQINCQKISITNVSLKFKLCPKLNFDNKEKNIWYDFCFLFLNREPNVKRTICKRCGLVLKPGISSELNLDRNGNKKVCRIECAKCGFSKRFVLNPKYNLWLDDEKSINEVILPNECPQRISSEVPTIDEKNGKTT